MAIFGTMEGQQSRDNVIVSQSPVSAITPVSSSTKAFGLELSKVLLAAIVIAVAIYFGLNLVQKFKAYLLDELERRSARREKCLRCSVVLWADWSNLVFDGNAQCLFGSIKDSSGQCGQIESQRKVRLN